MSGVQGITTGNIADTPLKNKGTAHMSPTEKAAFEAPKAVEPEAQALPAEANSPEIQALKWETVSTETFSPDRIGDAQTSFSRTVRRLKVEGGWIYSISCVGQGYIRGNTSVTSSESSVFVPEAKATKASK